GLLGTRVDAVTDAIAILVSVDLRRRWRIDRLQLGGARDEREREHAAEVRRAEPCDEAAASGAADRDPGIRRVAEAEQVLARDEGRGWLHRTRAPSARQHVPEQLARRPQRIEHAERGSDAPREPAALLDVR